jgi:phosphoenolpyruvate---glycerone phosphotransferase subunit DhaL
MSMESFPSSNGAAVIDSLVRAIVDNAALLSEVDGAIGDGDHGINMKKGFSRCAERLSGKQFGLTEGLQTLGTVLLTEIGGAMGPLYGTFFCEMANASEGHDSIDAGVFKAMLDKSVAGVVELGGAKEGDKTLLDTLIPATEAFGASLRSGASFRDSLGEMRAAAEKGKESTRAMVAKIGRASRLGERSRGALDAGAVSCWLIVTSMAESMSALLG